MQLFSHAMYLSIERVLVLVRMFSLRWCAFCIMSDLTAVALVQPCAGERPRSLWQSSTLLWDEARSHSTWQENNESRCEGKSVALKWWKQAESQIFGILITPLHSSGHEKSHQQEHRHAGVLSTTVSTWNHRSSWGSFQGQERAVVVIAFLSLSDLQIYFYSFPSFVYSSWLYATTSHCTWMPV